MIPYFAYQRKRFFDFCLEKFYFSHTFRQEGGLLPQKGTESVEMRTTDMADELFSGAAQPLPPEQLLQPVQRQSLAALCGT